MFAELADDLADRMAVRHMHRHRLAAKLHRQFRRIRDHVHADDVVFGFIRLDGRGMQ